MATIKVSTRNGAQHFLTVSDGSTVMEAIRDDGIDEILAICGGCLSCATCHVLVDKAWMEQLPAISDEESQLLEGVEGRQANSRLSCQIVINSELDGLVVDIAPE